jgi:hypothetical protein
MRRCTAVLALAPFFVAFAATRAGAQPAARTLDELSRRLAPGDVIWVTDMTGHETRGRVSGVSDRELRIDVGPERRQLPSSDVVRVRQRRPDPLWTGAAIGTASALVFPIGLCSSSSESGETCGDNVAGLVLTGLMGAAIGAWVDALVQGRTVVYERGPQSGLRIGPTLSPRRGLGVQATWSPLGATPRAADSRPRGGS